MAGSNTNSTPKSYTTATMAIDCSYFKPEFSGKPEEDPEGHILNDN